MGRRVVVGFSGGVTSAWCAGWALRSPRATKSWGQIGRFVGSETSRLAQIDG